MIALTFMVSVPMFDATQPALSLSISLGTYAPGVAYVWDIVSLPDVVMITPSEKSQVIFGTFTREEVKCTFIGLQPFVGTYVNPPG